MSNLLRDQSIPPMPIGPRPNPVGCLGFPIFLTLISLSLGIYLALHWPEYTLLPHIVTILLLTLGSILAFIILIFFVIMYMALRMARQLKRDVQNLADTARYMVKMDPNAPLHPNHPPIDVIATEVPPDAASPDYPVDPNGPTDTNKPDDSAPP